METLNVLILTPYGQYLSNSCTSLQVQSDEFLLGILPEHAPLVATLPIGELTINFENEVRKYAVGGGVLKVEKQNKAILLVDSIEYEKDIDVDRALSAKNRAEKRLAEAKQNSNIDEKRAKLALARALNRLSLINKN